MIFEFAVFWAALRTGLFYGMLGLAYFLVLRTTGLLNFSVGAYAMLGGVAFGGLTMGHGVGTGVAVLLALGCAIAAALATEALVVTPIVSRTTGEFGPVMAIVALLFVLEQLAALLFGHATVVAPRLVDGVVSVGGTKVTRHDLVGAAASLAVISGLAVWVKRSKYGRLLRAIGDNQEAALSLGLLVRRVRYIAMALAGAVAGLAGLLVAPLSGLTFEAATSFAVIGFIALVVGGTASVWAPMAGGLLVSFLESYGSLAFGSTSRDYILLAVVLATFLIRPQGLFAIEMRT